MITTIGVQTAVWLNEPTIEASTKRKVHCQCTTGKCRFELHAEGARFFSSSHSNFGTCPKCGKYYYFFIKTEKKRLRDKRKKENDERTK